MVPILYKREDRPFVISGPCSAESRTQIMHMAQEMSSRGVDLFRAGLWKPRTRPHLFEGVGEEGLDWLVEAKNETGIRVSIEVANTHHVELALKKGIDVVWIGARTSANPFSVQEIADALRGVEIPVFVKNPINPDLRLWMGAVERIQHAGIEDIGLIHRGFSFFNTDKYRNSPLWQIPIDMRAEMPDIMMICDVSHICGQRNLLQDVAQAAMDLGFDGLMIETHPDPENAKTDSAQQITPLEFDSLLSSLVIRSESVSVVSEREEVIDLRDQIDALDAKLVELLGMRMQLVERIGDIKDQYNIPVLQPTRWQAVLERARLHAQQKGLSTDFIEELFKAIHQESIHHQLMVMNSRVETK
jgi:chorismate mutase